MVSDVFTATPGTGQYWPHNAIVLGRLMKNIPISRICCLTIICFLGFSPVAYMRAQQAVTITPEVKTDVLDRLETARNFQVSKPSSGDGGYKKMVMRICNQGPKGG